ncbi:MAG: hypothetical protein C0404_05040 [Verrucomicrobia bacterium]|nr:hypothetical protein [Verrucomicrobiota bacterium]
MLALLFVMGQKEKERPAGYVADFCPICRGITRFRVMRHSVATHVYGLSLGDGQLLRHMAVCRLCGNSKKVHPARYETISSTDERDLDRLIAATYPQIRESYGERLAIEVKLRNRQAEMTPDERHDFLMEPFNYLIPAVEARYQKDVQFDKESGIAGLGTIGLSVLTFIVCSKLWPDPPAHDWVSLMTGWVLVVGSAYTFVQLCLGPGRYLRKKVIPDLARALKPLNPSRDELEECLAALRDAKLKIGTKVKPQQLWFALQLAQPVRS